jgi:hypothetical protein
MDMDINDGSASIIDKGSGLEGTVELSTAGLQERGKYDIVLNSLGENVIDYNRRTGDFPTIFDMNTWIDEYGPSPYVRPILIDYTLDCSELLKDCLAERKRAAQKYLKKIGSKNTLYWIAAGAIAGAAAGSYDDHPFLGGAAGGIAGLLSRVYVCRRRFMAVRDRYAEELKIAYNELIETTQGKLDVVDQKHQER